jgi:glutamyl-tRNA reductase
VSALVVGLSYQSAPFDLLERAALDSGACRLLEARLALADHVTEAVVLSTCNRLEVYAEVARFHGGVRDLGEALAEATGLSLDDLSAHLYAHYDEHAVAHLFSVAAGLDSMAVGEQQILGQVRLAFRAAQQGGTVARALAPLMQHALRTGKRVHAETALDRVAHGLVETGLERAAEIVGPLPQATALVLGAGAMSGLAVATLRRFGVTELMVANRSPERALRLTADGGRALSLVDLPVALADADVVLACTGAVGHLVDAELAATAAAVRRGRPQVYLDLALPRDIDPAVADLPGVRLVDLAALGSLLAGRSAGAEVDQARALVAAEVESYLTSRRADVVAPTVVALRAMAAEVVEAELTRLRARLPDLDTRATAELDQTVRRVVDKLLHTPTVRVKQLADGPDGSSYAAALRQLFNLSVETDDITLAELTDPRGRP